MKYPTLTEIPSTREMVDVFSGYNHNLRINDGEFFEMKNLTSSQYPVLAPRPKRGTYASVSNPLGMIAKDVLCHVDGKTFYIHNKPINGLELDENTHKQLVSIGAYVIILPDKKWVNTAKYDINTNTFNPTDSEGNVDGYGDIDASYEIGVESFARFTLCKADGTGYDTTNGATAPANPTDGQYWLDTSSVPHSLKVYSASNSVWTSVATTYVKIEASGIDKQFDLYDGIKIEGLSREISLYDYNSGDKITGNTREQLANLDGSALVWAKGENYIVVVGILDEEKRVRGKLSFSRKMPDMDFVIESQNRLWGCKYGIVDGKAINEIYASMQGNFKNWNCFIGQSKDSYAASCGTDGKFTGAITHLGYPLFFKDGYMHKVYGNYPANFQIQTIECRGVQDNCHKSLAIVNEVLYYKSRTGVMAYDGSLPVEVSYALGDVSYVDAVACGHGNKYYISMEDGYGAQTLFVYDVKRGVWHKEDDVLVDMFCSCGGEVYFISPIEGAIKTVFGSGALDEKPVEWMAQTGPLTISSPDKKYISRMNVRMQVEVGTKVHFFIQYDSIGEWEHVYSTAGNILRTFSVHIRTKRCDHLRLRIEGVGDARIYSITKTIEQGSDI